MNNNTQFMSWLYYSINIDKIIQYISLPFCFQVDLFVGSEGSNKPLLFLLMIRLLCKSQSRSLKPIEFNFVFKSCMTMKVQNQ